MWESEKKQVIEAAQAMERKGLVVGTAGNISMRLKDPDGRELLAITPSGRYYDLLKVDDIVVVDFAGQRVGGEIKVAQYGFPGTPDLAKNVVSALGPRNAVILANHGVLSVGRDMREALTICELAEELAKIYVSALGLGKVNQLAAEVIELEKAFFTAIYGEGE